MTASTIDPRAVELIYTQLTLVLIAEPSPSYCWKLVADELGQRRVSTVVLVEVGPPARKVQHSPSVEL